MAGEQEKKNNKKREKLLYLQALTVHTVSVVRYTNTVRNFISSL